jgi:hypothetical protein
MMKAGFPCGLVGMKPVKKLLEETLENSGRATHGVSKLETAMEWFYTALRIPEKCFAAPG